MQNIGSLKLSRLTLLINDFSPGSVPGFLISDALALSSPLALSADYQFRAYTPGMTAPAPEAAPPAPVVAPSSELFGYSGAKTSFTAPKAGVFEFDVVGGAGSGQYPGAAARIVCSVSLLAGETLTLLVGGQGTDAGKSGSGGGGSFVVKTDNTPLCIAGGGAGWVYLDGNSTPGSTAIGGSGLGGSATGGYHAGGAGGGPLGGWR